MVRVVFGFLMAFSVSGALSQDNPPPIGEWREHLPYNSAIDVVAAGERIFCATPYSLFAADPESGEIERFSRMTGLSETGVSTIAWDPLAEKLVIAYTNSNIDIVSGNQIINVPDIKRENIPGDKSVYAIFPQNNRYFLSTGLGVILVDGNKYEVSDSWQIGNAGLPVRVNDFVADGAYYYAATTEGLKRIGISATNPADYTNWQVMSGSNGLPAGDCRFVALLSGNIVVLHDDSLYAWNGSNWSLFYTDGWPVINIHASEDRLLVCERMTSGESRVLAIDPGGNVALVLQQPGLISFPQKAIRYRDEYWVADLFGSLSRFYGPGSFVSFEPDGPENIASGQTVFDGKTYYAAAGSVNAAWNYQFNGNGVYRFTEGKWTNFNRFNYPVLDSVLDIITVAVDPVDQSIWAGSFGGGLLHISTGPQFEIFKKNSSLQEAIGDPGSYRISGLAFDALHNLWVANYGAPQPLHIRKPDGSWQPFSIPFTLTENAVAQIVTDDLDQKWIVAPKGNGLVCLNTGADPDNTSDDRWKYYRYGAGNGNLPSSEVYCVAKDKNGFIWVGTADGIALIRCPQQVFTPEGCDAFLPVIREGNFAGYLFKGEEVTSIAVDGADRKWVGTRNGVWLVSQEGDKILYRFTEDNSPLLSNDIRSIALNGVTGEVYFATARGICSFRSTATEGGTTNRSVLVFPNPVPPGYTGTIAIRGLVDNAIVKITEPDGRLVYQTRALGGQATWDGKDYRGRKIASGLYLVLVSDDARTTSTAARIIFVSK